MRSLSFRYLLISLIGPVFAYLLTIHYVETLLNRYLVQAIPTIILPKTSSVDAGLETVESAINRNVQTYLKKSWLSYAGITPFILVSSKEGKILYPSSKNDEELSFTDNKDHIRAENQGILKQGLQTDVDLRIENNSILGIGILTIYLSISGSCLAFRMREGLLLQRKLQLEAQSKLDQLITREKDLTAQLAKLGAEKEFFLHRLEHLRSDYAAQQVRYNTQEEELLQEIIELEERFKEQLTIQHQLESELHEQHTEIERLRNKTDSTRKTKAESHAVKRLQMLYKNLELNERALDGFLALNDELQLKGEEILQQLNMSEDLGVKRKITGRRLRQPIFEIPFGYRGRLYFTKKEARTEVLAIGDKNSQSKDLDYLETL